MKRDELLVTIDPDPYAAEVDRAQAQVVAAQARVNYAKSEHERAQRLWDESAIARRELDERVNAAQEADANLRAAQAALQSARLNLAVHRGARAGVRAASAGSRSPWATWSPPGPGAPVLDDSGLRQSDLRQLRCRRACGPAGSSRWRSKAIAVEAETVTNGGRQLQGPAAAHRQPGEHAQRHGARARGVRQQGRQPDPRPVREAAHGQGEDRARRCW